MIEAYLKKLFKKIKDVRELRLLFYKAITENLTLKLIAVMMTLTLFLLVAGESVQISKTIKVEYLTAETMMIVNSVPFEVEMILSGPKSIIGILRPKEFSYKVNLVNAGVGTSGVRINPRELGLDRGVIVLSMMPSIIYPRLEKVIRKKVAVQFIPTGVPRLAHIRSITLDPKEVEISGPESYVQNISSIATESLDLSRVTKSDTYHIKLILPDPLISIVQPEKSEIKVHVEISAPHTY